MTTREPDLRGPDVVAPPPLLFAVPLAIALAMDRVAPTPRLPRATPLIGLVPLLGGLSLAAWFISAMRRADTPVSPAEPPRALVNDGPFAHTRNPGYLGMSLVYTGVSLLGRSCVALLLLPGVLLAVDRGVIEREETYLRRQFGDAYSDYLSRVPRWL